MTQQRLTVEYQGKEYSILQLSRLVGIPEQTLRDRIVRGKTAEQAVAAGKPRPRGRMYEFRGERMNVGMIAACCGVNADRLRRVLKLGYTAEDAVETMIKSPAKITMEVPREIALSPKQIRENAARCICENIAKPEEIGFRCVEPMTEYAFSGDILGYTIRFEPDGNTARLTAHYRRSGMPSGFGRVYRIDGESAKEIYAGEKELRQWQTGKKSFGS